MRPSRDAASELQTVKLGGSEIEKSKFQLWPVLSQTQTDGNNTIDKNSKYNFVAEFNLAISLVYSAFPSPTHFWRKETKTHKNDLTIELKLHKQLHKQLDYRLLLSSTIT